MPYRLTAALLAAMLLVVIAAGHSLLAAQSTPSHHVFIPHASVGFCGPFYDHFNHPTGWFTGRRDSLLAEYVDGEYRMLVTEKATIWLVGAPTCERLDYRAEVDARWAGQPANFYALVFGVSGRLDRAFLFAVNTDVGAWMVYRIDENGLDEVIPPTRHDAVRPGGEVNRLAVERQGQTIHLSINDTAVGELRDANPGEPVAAGLAVASYTFRAPADARFDNFYYLGAPAGPTGDTGPAAVHIIP